MTGEPRESMDTPITDRLPPITTSHPLAPAPDNSLAGALLPPYRAGMYAGLQWKTDAEASAWAAAPEAEDLAPPVEDVTSSWSAAPEPEEEVGPPVSEGWPAEWRDDPLPMEEAEPLPEMLLLDEAEVQPVEAERDPTGYEQAAEDMTAWETPALEAAGGDWAAAWDDDDAAVYDLPGAAAEDTGAWQDSWAEPFEVEEQVEADEAPFASSEAFDVAETVEPPFMEGPEPAADVHEWLETGAVDSSAWDLGAESTEAAPAEAAFEPPAAEQEVAPRGEESVLHPPAAEAAGDEQDRWLDAGVAEETGELIEMVEEPGLGATLEFVPADTQEQEAPADAAWAPFEAREEPGPEAITEPHEEPVAAVTEGRTEDLADERVAIVPPTPLDSWYHGEHADEAQATWEAFGRALEEAASWGDLGATIATGMPPAEGGARGEPAEAVPAAEAVADAAPAAIPAEEAPAEAPSDPAVSDLARRLELLAQRIRAEGEKGVEHAMAEGDRLEASLAGFIAGYVAARRG